MPSKYRQFERLFVPSGTPAGDTGVFRKEYYLNSSNWEYYPGTKRPDLRKQNPHDFASNFVEDAWVTPGYFFGEEVAFHPTYALGSQVVFYWPSQVNEALARFNGRVRKGSASMGVTLASWKQSRDMIVKRSKDAGRALDGAYKSLKNSPSRRRQLRRSREPLANEVLEVEFGWKPLAQDFRAALTTVCQDGIPPQYVRGVAQRDGLLWSYQGSDVLETRTGSSRVTVAASVSISNPNLWLLNRLGLINPITVIWDLVPWSFLVNMFVNVNQMVSSITDEVGLDITDKSTTYSSNQILESFRYGPGNFIDLHGRSLRGLLVGQSRVKERGRFREVGSFPAPSWVVKVPDLNWELAVIATSLLLQKAQRLNNLIKGF
jgi:hypothetical protein